MREKFAHWNVLLLQYLKRDWKLIIGWVVGMGVFSGGFVPAFLEIGKGNGLVALYETMKNPAMISIVGPTPVKDAAGYTIGAMYSHTMLLFCGLFAMIIAALHVVNHTRKEEESGLTEFVCSYRVGRHANTLALMVEELIIHALLTLLTAGLLASFGVDSMDMASCFLFGVSLGLAGIIGAVIALLMAQIMPTATGASGSSLGIIGGLYILRAATDIYDADWSMLNPMGWSYMTFPFTENNVIPLAYCVIFSVIIIFISLLLERNRDMGAGYLRERAGRAKVKKSLLSVPGLLLRLNRTVIISWLIGFICMGSAYGSIYGEMQSFLDSNELMRTMFMMEGISVEESFTSVILAVLGGLSAILPVVIVNKLYAEEANGHMSQVHATKVTRAKLYWTTIVIAVVAGAVGIFASAGSLAASGISTMKESNMEISDFLTAGMNYFPAILFVIAIAALVLGWIPKLGRLIYVYVGYAMMLNYFQGILKLPEWIEKTAIFSWFPRMPMEEFDAVVFFAIMGVSVLLMVVGYIGYKRRDLHDKA